VDLRYKTIKKMIVLAFILIFETVFPLTIIAPNGSMVYYNNKLMGTIEDTPLTINVNFPGELKVVKPGYVPFEQVVTEDGTITVSLVLPSMLSVKINPPTVSSYDVYVNGKFYVKSNEPVLNIQLGPGKHEIIIDAEGFLKKTTVVELLPGEIKSVEVNLKNTVTLRILSSVELKDVYFDYTKISIPTTIETTPGEHIVHLPANFVYNIQRFLIPKVDTYTININTTTYKKLRVFGQPSSAYVNILGSIYTSPLEKDLPEGVYEIEISAPGYKTNKISVDLRKDETVFFTLEPVENKQPLTHLEGYTILLDGFPVTFGSDTMKFTTITDNSTDVVVWYGISKGVFQSLPRTIPLIISEGVEVELANIVYKGPALLQIFPGSTILTNDGLKVQEIKVEKLTILDKPEKCIVNIYGSKDNEHINVYWDGVFVGKTPIYFFITSQGEHNLTFRTSLGNIETKVFVEAGKVNEFLFRSSDKKE